jgi:Xaa-Pro aminopeptidase
MRRAQARMREQGIDVLVVADPANMDWLTGYDNWSFIGMWMDDWGYVFSETVAVTEDGGESLSSFPRELVVKS